ncbi:unnamed protein product [Laminaria digitata]
MFSLFLLAGTAQAQQSELLLNIPNSEDATLGYTTGSQSGARGISGPYDLDADGLFEVLLADYTGGGRVHVIENVSADTWELVYSTPWADSTGSTSNARYAVGTDLDGDGFGEIVFLSGRNYSETNPMLSDLPPGIHVYEYTGTGNDYGSAPATIYEFDGDLPDRWVSEQLAVADIDDDGVEELMMPNNGGSGFNNFDNWYVLSVTGDIGTGFDVWNQEVRISSRATEDFDPVGRGGGSAYAIHPADFDGDGSFELSLHSWNSFNFTNGDVTGADTYSFPADGAQNGFLNASAGAGDHVSLFGGVVADIDGNGDDEVFYPRFQTGAVSMLNYESGEDASQITADNFVLDLIPGLTSLGITAGDMDGDGAMELIGAGNAFTSSSFEAGNEPAWIRVAEFNGGDPEDPNNYSVESVSYSEASDLTGAAFDTVQRDSAGVMTEYLEEGDNGAEFVSKLAYLGDPDLDGFVEVALAFQGLDDSTFVFAETFNPADSSYTRTVTSSASYENRIFMRVLSGGAGFAVSIEDERIIVPSDYKLHSNYPNPFNPTTTISFTLPLDKAVSVRVYDMTGRLVRTLANNQFYSEGFHEVSWDATNDAGNQVASGSYLYTLEYGNFRQSKTMVLIK